MFTNRNAIKSIDSQVVPAIRDVIVNFLEQRTEMAESICESVIDAMRDLSPDEVFERDVLEQWAQDNGFVKE